MTATIYKSGMYANTSDPAVSEIDNNLPFNEWISTFKKLGNELQTLTDSTENEFLSIGAKLRTFSSQAKNISKLTLSAANFLACREIIDAIENLHEMLNRINGYLVYCEAELEHNKEALDAVLKIINSIDKPLEGFEKLVRKLRILGISTRIESVQLDNSNNNFNTLSEDVRNLSDVINSKLDSISEGSKLLGRIIRRALSQIADLKARQFTQAAKILEDIKACLASLTDKNSMSSTTAKQIASESNEIHLQVEKMVECMQFHDIICQKIQHAKEALDMPIEMLIAYKENHRQDFEELITTVGDTCELQAVQLDYAKDELVSATNDIIDGLRGITDSINVMAKATRTMVFDSDRDGSMFLNKVESGIRDAIKSLSENVKTNLELNQAMNPIVNRVDEMAVFVNDIQQIGMRIELIALNGLITAAHIGDEGKTLGVLAEAIQRVSVDARQQIVLVSDILKKIISSTDKLTFGSDYDTERAGVGDIIENMINDLKKFAGSLRQVNDKVDIELTNIVKGAQTFSIDIRKTTTEISVHNIFEKVLSRAISAFSAIVSQSRNIAPITDLNKKAERLQMLENRYSIHSERIIHQSQMQPESDRVSISVSDDLGENVELF